MCPFYSRKRYPLKQKRHRRQGKPVHCNRHQTRTWKTQRMQVLTRSSVATQTIAFNVISRVANLNGVRIANHVRKEEEIVIGSRRYHARCLAVGTQPRLAWTAHPGVVDERTPVEG